MKSELYPLKFIPIMKERIWAGTKLSTLLGKSSHSVSAGESWELSAVEGSESVVAEGSLKGHTLPELISRFGPALLGKRVQRRFGDAFPLLIKFLDAGQDLSVQVHPTDKLASERHNSLGKTEMWYIMQADRGARLNIGFRRDVSKELFRESVEKDRLSELLHFVEVKEGDAFMINAGTIHAVGAGIMLAEIQQTSDITYRVYDYERVDAKGERRELHTEQALDALVFEKREDFVLNYPKHRNIPNPVVNSPYFITSYLDLARDIELDTQARDAFTVYMCLHGSARITNAGGEAEIRKGETVLLAAASGTIRIETTDSKLLEVTI